MCETRRLGKVGRTRTAPLFVPPQTRRDRDRERMASEIVYDLVQADDIDRAFEIESAGFPPDEAASLESLQSAPLRSVPLLSCAHARSSLLD